MQTILVVEAEPSLLIFLVESLEEQGFDVVGARSGGEALGMLSSPIYDIAALVTAIGIGTGLDGWEIACFAREITPGLPVVYMIDDSADDRNVARVSDSRMLRTPVTRGDLAAALDGLLVPA